MALTHSENAILVLRVAVSRRTAFAEFVAGIEPDQRDTCAAGLNRETWKGSIHEKGFPGMLHS